MPLHGGLCASGSCRWLGAWQSGDAPWQCLLPADAVTRYARCPSDHWCSTWCLCEERTAGCHLLARSWYTWWCLSCFSTYHSRQHAHVFIKTKRSVTNVTSLWNARQDIGGNMNFVMRWYISSFNAAFMLRLSADVCADSFLDVSKCRLIGRTSAEIVTASWIPVKDVIVSVCKCLTVAQLVQNSRRVCWN